MPHTMITLMTNEVVTKVPCTCVDGRTSGMRYSAAGGSFGLMVHLLNHLPSDQDVTDEQLRSYIRYVGKHVSPVYLHSDQHALDLIYAKLGFDPGSRLLTLTDDQQRSFIELATRADFQGCGHIKLLMTQPDQYQVNTELLKRLLSQFFKAFFAGDDGVLFDVLAGQHKEEQVLIIEEQSDLSRDMTTLYQEDTQGPNAFFCHRPLKRELIARLNNALNEVGIEAFDEAEVLKLKKLHDQHAEITLGHLASDLNITKIAI